MKDSVLKVGSHQFDNRLILGTGKYPSFDIMRQCHEASGAELVTVALRRVNLADPSENILNFIDTKRLKLLPNTAGCYTAEDAIQVARLARELDLGDLIKIEVIGDEKTLMPDPIGTLKATEVLAREGFTVMAYCSDDVVLSKHLESAGAAAIMPLGSPIGSGRGILNPANILLIRELVKVPVIVDAGVGCASDCALAMELGVDGVLLNTAVAAARDPVAMARAVRLATEAGRLSYLAGRIARKAYASASTPLKDF